MDGPTRQHGIANRQRRARPNRDGVLALLDRVLAAEGEERGVEIAFIGMRSMRALHETWLGDDSPTDVMSFPSGSPTPGAPPDAATLGEVVICVPHCEESAREHGIALHDEIARVMIHGILHLLGYDHRKPGEARRMRRRENRHLRWYRRSGLEVVWRR